MTGRIAAKNAHKLGAYYFPGENIRHHGRSLRIFGFKTR